MIYAEGIEETIKKLEQKKKLNDRLHEVIDRLAKIGMNVAKASYQTAAYDGPNDTKVRVDWENDNTCAVIAYGYHVFFIEFGSGTIYQDHPLGPSLGMIHGKFGERGDASRYPRGWVYVGPMGSHPTFYAHHPQQILKDGTKGEPDPTKVVTRGNPPSMSMYFAGKEIEAKIGEVVKEVFR